MLNYIWLALVVIGILVAVVIDLRDISTNKFQNGKEYDIIIQLSDYNGIPPKPYSSVPCSVIYSMELDLIQEARFIPSEDRSGVLHIFLNENAPVLWKEIFNAQQNGDYLLANVKWNGTLSSAFKASLSFPTVKFVKLNNVTNNGIVRYAKTAVEIAIGLIGIMALWLGLMKIAEASGLIQKLASILKPMTKRLFPDVPPDHPAMGAMIMNISANILGLANAATPLGLKAMEELNKLNKKLGTATDAMCTFLVINTSNVQLIPATVIAIRAAAGSSNPTEIIGPVIIATSMSTIVGLIVVKLLAKLRIFKNQLKLDN